MILNISLILKKQLTNLMETPIIRYHFLLSFDLYCHYSITKKIELYWNPLSFKFAVPDQGPQRKKPVVSPARRREDEGF